MKYSEYKIEDFLEELSSTKSMPGGGVAASLTAANGISATLKVCNLTIGKEKYKENESLVKTAKEKCESLKNRFKELMDKDAEIFKFMEQVYTMPKITDEDKEKRKKTLQEACKKCCTIPKEIIENAIEGIKVTTSLYGKSNVSAESDLVVGNILLRAAIDGAWQNILVNLKYIEDDNFIEEYDKFGKQVMKEIL